jgi:hypothetical protein
MTVGIGVEIEFILTDVDIAIVRIKIFGFDEAARAEQFELLLDTCADTIAIGRHAIVIDRASTVIETAGSMGGS